MENILKNLISKKMANNDLTLGQMNQIDEFIQKHKSINVTLALDSADAKDVQCIIIGNAARLGTLLSRLEQKSLSSIPNLMDYVKYFDPQKHKYLLLRAI